MAKLQGPNSESLYAAATKVVEVGLRGGGSLFVPGHDVWTEGAARELTDSFVDRPDESSDSFDVKLARQLKPVSAEAKQLAGELEFVRLLATDRVTPLKKKANIESILRLGAFVTTVPLAFQPALAAGLANPGTGFNPQKPFHLRLLIKLLSSLRALPAQEAAAVLNDPWKFKEFVFTIDAPKARSQQNAILHLVFPDTFEPIVARRHKRLIVAAFGPPGEGGQETDYDHAILQARQSLEPGHGAGFSWYQSDIRRLWAKNEPEVEEPEPQATWPDLVKWAQRLRLCSEFDAEERDYKLAIADSLGEVRSLVLNNDPSWTKRLAKVFSAPKYNLTPWQSHSKALDWVKADPSGAARVLKDAWSLDDGVTCAERLVADLPPDVLKGLGGRSELASVLAMAYGAEHAPPFRTWPFKAMYNLVDFEWPATASPAPSYRKAIGFLDRVLEEDRAVGGVLRDRLDAQGVVWMLANERAPKSWTEEDRRAFLAFLKGGVKAEVGPTETAEATGSLDSLAEELYLDAEFLGNARDLLGHKKQVIFYGPPGTGKTYVAKALAEHLAGDAARVMRVQLHPSYAYEDFVEGYRPMNRGGQVVFEIVKGPLRKIADLAAAQPDHTYVLVIDELNRGNVSKVFGELFYLLEYRGDDLTLQYSGDGFCLPRNLLIIGTMNTADRSIALIDGALRRRFHFIGFQPDEEPVRGLLLRWLTANHPALLWVAAVVDAANEKLGSPHMAIGPSHFMRTDLSERWVELIWRHSIMPTLEEHFFGQEVRLEEFSLERLRDEVGVEHDRG